MKKLLFIKILLIFAFAGSAMANVTYTDTLDLYNTYDAPDTDWWYHANPAEAAGMTSEEYTAAALAGDVDISLTIVVDDLDSDELIQVEILDQDTFTWHVLGILDTQGFTDAESYDAGEGHALGLADSHISTTTFSGIIDPLWLDGLPVEIRFLSFGSSYDFEIETSSLTVSTLVPAPGAILLGGIGVCLVGWLRRRQTL